MKHLFRSLIFAAFGALMVVSCQEKPAPEPVEKPVVTADMYSVTVNSETGEVTFRFTEVDLNPYWIVTDPNGATESFYDREVTKKYELPGIYTGKISAFGAGGESDPVQFTFNPLGTEVDETLSATENILVSQPWKPYTIVYYGGSAEDETYWEWDSESVPTSAADDRLTFKKDGTFVLDLGNDTAIYHDMNAEFAGVTLTGAEKWAYVVESGVEYIQFSDGGFPGMLADDEAVNARYELRNVSANRFELHYYQAAQEQSLNFVFVSESYVEEPVEGTVTEESAKSALSGKTFSVSRFGWWGTGWEYFDDPVPESTAEDLITFNADGTLAIDLGESLLIYHDGGWRTVEQGWFEDEQWVVTGAETWAVQSDPTGVFVKFDNGGFPLMLAGQAGVAADDPTYNWGLNAKWTVAGIEEGTVRLDIYQEWTGEQWFTVFLTPVQ